MHNAGTKAILAVQSPQIGPARKKRQSKRQPTLQQTPDIVIQREHQLKCVPKLSTPRTVRPGPAYQAQLLSSFMRLNYPTPSHVALMKERGSFIQYLADLDSSGLPLIQSALATVCCASNGTYYNDQRLLHAANDAYGMALATMIRHVNGKSQQYPPRMVLTGMLLLTLHDCFLPGGPQSSTWQTHFEGGMAYFKMVGASCFDMEDMFDRKVVSQLLRGGLSVSLVKRKLPVLTFAEMPVLAPMGLIAYVKLREIEYSIIEIVAKTEICCFDNPENHEDSLRLWNEIMTWRKDVNDWMENDLWNGETKRVETDLQHISDIEGFDMNISEHCFMTTNTTFTSFHRLFGCTDKFGGKTWALTDYWRYALIAECMLLRLLHFQPWLAQYARETYSITQHDIEQAAYTCATRLCRSLYCVTRLEGQAYAAWTMILCNIAQNLFFELGAMKEFGWCQGILLATKARLTEMVTVGGQMPTMCRLPDLLDGFSNLSLFRAGDFRGR